MLLSALAATTGCAATDDGGRPITVVVAPHPDDEIQAWGALPDDRQAGDVLLVFLTKGERTAFCAPERPGLDEARGERPPEPRPDGRDSATCKQARVTSTVRFLEQMHQVDPSFPSVARTGTGTSFGADLHPGDDVPVVFFDLGDGALTGGHVRDAIDAVVDHRDEIGLPTERPFGDIVGASYANTDDASCFVYEHPDHLAVADVLLGDQLEAFRSQLVPVCANQDGAEHLPVDVELFDAAFAVDGEQRVGAHTVEYGWLLDPFWIGDRDGQGELFHRDQWFSRGPR